MAHGLSDTEMMSGIMPLNRQAQLAYSNRHLDSISTKLANLEQRLSVDPRPYESPTRRSGNVASSTATSVTESIVAGNVPRNLTPSRHTGVSVSPAIRGSNRKSEDQSYKGNEHSYGTKEKAKKELFTSSFNDMSTDNEHHRSYGTSQDISKMEEIRESLHHIISPINSRTMYQNENVNHSTSSPVSDQFSNGFHDNERQNESLESMKTEALLSMKPHVSPSSLDSGIVFHQGALQQRHAYVPNSSLITENQILRDSLDGERYRRKHCEEQISELQAKLLESQQQLAVAVSTDRKKDIMVQQLDKTLAKVVDGWKKNEEEKVAVIAKMKGEKEEAEKMQERQKQLLATFEKDLAQAVNQLSKEQQRAVQVERDKQAEIQACKEQREESLQLVQEEKQKRQATEEMKQDLYKQIKELQDRIAKERDLKLEIQLKLQKELQLLSEKHFKELESEQESSAAALAKSTEAEECVKALHAEMMELKEQLQDNEQEKENLRLEVEMQAAKFEASRLRQDTESQAEIEKTIANRMKELETRMQQEQKKVQESHRQQVQHLLEGHQKEIEAMDAKAHEELQSMTVRWKNVVQDLQQRLDDRSMEMSSLKQRLDLEGGHYVDLIGQFQRQCQELMQWIQVLRNPDDHKEIRNYDTFQKNVPRTGTSNLAWTPPKQSYPLASSSPAVKLTNQMSGTYTSSAGGVTNVTTHHHHPHGYVQEFPDGRITQDKARLEMLSNYPSRQSVTHSALSETSSFKPLQSSHSSRVSISQPALSETSSFKPLQSSHSSRVSSTQPALSENSSFKPLQLSYPSRVPSTQPALSENSSFKPLHAQYDDQQTSSFVSEQEHETIDRVPEKEESLTDLSVGPLESTVIERDTYNGLTDKFQKHTQKQQELQRYIQMLLERSPGSPVLSKDADSPKDISPSQSTNTAKDNGEPSTEILTLDQLSEISKLLHVYHHTEEDDTFAEQQPSTPDQMMAYLKVMQSRVAKVQEKQQLIQPTNPSLLNSHMIKTSMGVIKDKPATVAQNFYSMVQKDHTVTRISKAKPVKASGPEAKMRTRNQRGNVPPDKLNVAKRPSGSEVIKTERMGVPSEIRQSQTSRKAVWK